MSDTPDSRGLWDTIWPWIEPVVAAGVGFVLYFPLHRKDLAEITWILGFLLSFGSLATARRLKTEFEMARKLSEVVDLTRQCNVPAINEILQLYIGINESEFRSLKDDIIGGCVSKLNTLAHDKVIEVGSGEYHLWLIEMLRTTLKKGRVYAISVMAESAWFEIPAEKKYLEANIQAAKRGVRIERIFVSSRDNLRDARNRQVICKHIEHAKDGLVAWVVFIEDLALQDSSILAEIGVGMVLFGSRVALVDTSIPPDDARGDVTMNSDHLARCERLFERLKLHARRADSELFRELDEDAS